MITKKINIPIYDFSLTFIEGDNDYNYDLAAKEMKKFKLDEDELAIIKEGFSNKIYNGGWTFSYLSQKKFMIFIYPCKEECKRREVVNHELRHVVDDLLNYCSVDDKEASAYLQGYLSRYIY